MLIKTAFFWAIIARVYRHWYKSKHEDDMQTYLPEGIKFMITWVYIYIVSLVINTALDSISLLIQKIFG